jgi:mannosyltransferase OCH1-like enzyme
MAPRPPRRATGRSSAWTRDVLYWLLFLLLAAYHLYVTTTTHSTMALTSVASQNTYHQNLPPTSPSTSTRMTMDYPQVPLDILTASSISQCPSPLIYLDNRVVAATTTATSTTDRPRKIPKIIHMTSKSRCFPSNFYDNIQLWQQHKFFDDYSLYLHDDVAVDRLLSSSPLQSQHIHSLFPHLNLARKCLRSGAGLADLWRYVVLWEYGGMYTGTCFGVVLWL